MRLAVVSFRLCPYLTQPQLVTPLNTLSLNTGTSRELPLCMAEVAEFSLEVRWSQRTCLPRWWIEWEIPLIGSGIWTVGAHLGGTVWGGGRRRCGLVEGMPTRGRLLGSMPPFLQFPLTSWLSLPWGELAQLPVLASMCACCLTSLSVSYLGHGVLSRSKESGSYTYRGNYSLGFKKFCFDLCY